jgi:hypothetical protein
MNHLQSVVRLIYRLGTTQQKAFSSLPVDVIMAPLAAAAVVGAVAYPFYVRSLRPKPQVSCQTPVILLQLSSFHLD